MKLRAATDHDLQQIAEIHVAASLAAYGEIFPKEHFQSFTVESRIEAFRALLEEGEVAIDVATDERVLGFSVHAPSRDSDSDPRNVYEIQSIYVNPNAWKRGIGSALMRRAEMSAESSQFAVITLWVLERNDQAIRFYRHHGYQPDGCTKEACVAGKTFRELRLAKE